MNPQLRNPYWLALIVPLVLFLVAVAVGVSPDWISVPGRFAAFGLFGYIGARYVGKAPQLVWYADLTPEARNIVGWASVIVAAMLNLAYGAVVIAYGRPPWITSTYISPALIVLTLVGLSLVATSMPRFPPFGYSARGLSVVASFLIGALSAGMLFFAAQLPTVGRFLASLFVGLTHAI